MERGIHISTTLYTIYEFENLIQKIQIVFRMYPAL